MVELQTTWGWLPAIYLFLGGLGAGAYVTVSILRLAKPDKFKKTVTGGVWIVVAALAIGLVALVSEVSKPLQAMILFKSFINFSSWMAIGAWLLLATFMVVGLSALFTTDKIADWLGKLCKPLGQARGAINKVLAIVGIPLALAVAVYTGILLGSAPAIPLWNTWLLPVLFTVSALDTGLAAVSIVAAVVERDQGVERVQSVFEKTVMALVVLEAAVLAAFLVMMRRGGFGGYSDGGRAKHPVLGARGGRGPCRPVRPGPGAGGRFAQVGQASSPGNSGGGCHLRAHRRIHAAVRDLGGGGSCCPREPGCAKSGSGSTVLPVGKASFENKGGGPWIRAMRTLKPRQGR